MLTLFCILFATNSRRNCDSQLGGKKPSFKGGFWVCLVLGASGPQLHRLDQRLPVNLMFLGAIYSENREPHRRLGFEAPQLWAWRSRYTQLL